jgi:lipopolysaccharide biosynthesis regulator YciM
MIVLIIIVVALIVLVLYLYFYRRREKVSGRKPYIEALLALLENKKDLAMKKFKDAVNLDSDLMDAYIKLGDLYREKGDISRAIQVHQSLTVRPTLKKYEEKKIYYALVNDMFANNRQNKAISFLKEILKIDKKDQHARELILRIYEDMGNYGDCITLYEEGGIKSKTARQHAFYYASFAHNKLKSPGETKPEVEKEVINLLKKALKISSSSLSAIYYLAAYFEEKGDLKKAKDYYYKMITQHSDYAFLIIPKFEKLYFELNLFDEIIPIYEKIFHKNPKNFAIGLALADLYEKKNDTERAMNVYSKLSDLYPKSFLPKLRSLKTIADDETIKEKISEIENSLVHGNVRCTNCGFVTEEFAFLCPRCHAVESFLPYL